MEELSLRVRDAQRRQCSRNVRRAVESVQLLFVPDLSSQAAMSSR
jgi:hypothetical protein